MTGKTFDEVVASAAQHPRFAIRTALRALIGEVLALADFPAIALVARRKYLAGTARFIGFDWIAQWSYLDS